METPLQTLIKQLEDSISQELDVLEDSTKYEKGDVKQAKSIVSITQNTIKLAEQLLEAEKQTIISAYEYNADGIGFLHGVDYYEQTFNK